MTQPQTCLNKDEKKKKNELAELTKQKKIDVKRMEEDKS